MSIRAFVCGDILKSLAGVVSRRSEGISSMHIMFRFTIYLERAVLYTLFPLPLTVINKVAGDVSRISSMNLNERTIDNFHEFFI